MFIMLICSVQLKPYPIRGGGVAHHRSSVAAMGKGCLAACRPVKFEYGKIHMSGGYTTKPSPMKSKTVDDVNGQSKKCVRLSSSEAWLVYSTTGACHKNGSSIDRTSLLGALRDRIARLCDGVDVVDVAPVQAPDDYDPMLELAAGTGSSSDVTKAAGKQGMKRWRYSKNAAKHCIATLDMASECPGVDPKGTKIRNVSVFIEDRKQI